MFYNYSVFIDKQKCFQMLNGWCLADSDEEAKGIAYDSAKKREPKGDIKEILVLSVPNAYIKEPDKE